MKCPQCQSVLSSKETKGGKCPVCQGSLAGGAAPRAAATAAPLSPGRRSPDAAPPGNAQVKTLSPNSRLGMRAGGALAFLVGIGFLIFMVGPEFSRWFASFGWPRASGTVLESDVASAMVQSNRGRSRTVYQPRVRYAYEVNGKQYQGGRISFGKEATIKDDVSAWMTEAAANRVAKKYRKDAVVRVYYDPADPQYSVLHRSMNISAWGTFGLGAFLGYLGIRLGAATLLSDEAAARSSLWLWKRDLNYGDYACGGIPLALFGAAQFFPDLFR